MFAALLVGVLMLRKPCAQGTASFIDSFDPPVDAGGRVVPVAPQFVRVTGDETEEELRKKLGRLDAGLSDSGGQASD